MVKFFIAASWEDKNSAEFYARKIKEKYGWECTTEWWLHKENQPFLSAIEDLAAIRNSDILFVFNSGKKSEGKNIEIGYALALGIPVYIFGYNLTTIYRKVINYMGGDLPW
jgi:hypothetical protein